MKNSIIQIVGISALALIAYLYQLKVHSIKKTVIFAAILFAVCFAIYYWILPRLLVS